MRFFPIVGALWLAGAAVCPAGSPVRFNRDIRPILSENCFHCHGQDAARRKADLRLDTFEGATAMLEDGPALVPGKPENSALLQRMTSHDPDEQMPPPESNRKVTPAQVALVRQWIAEGAAYEKHWAFVPPVWGALPPAAAWDRQPWDAWIRSRLERDGLAPSPEATPEAWLRRASFDLTGFAPTPAALDGFTGDVIARGESAYRDAVERLLASPRYGERMTAEWLDAARYADTHGFNNDSMRSMWRWRDWVIDAFNHNLPYNQFITRQLAGDLLPEPALEDRIATGFGRNHVINSEGGIIDEEYRVEYVADRVRTLGMTWLGLTMECSRCHDHKYDPVTAKDYYQLYAFFNQVPEWGEDGRLANASPLIPAPTGVQQAELALLNQQIASAAQALPEASTAGRPLAEVLAFLSRAVSVQPDPAGAGFRVERKDGKLINGAKPEESSGLDQKVTDHPALGPVFAFPAAAWTVAPSQFEAGSHKAWTWQTSLRWRGGEGVLLSNMAWQIPVSSVSHGNGFEIRINAAGAVEVRMAQKWPAYAIQLETTTALRPDRWHQIAVVNHGTGTAAGLRVYVDGVESDVVVHHDGLSGPVGPRALSVGRKEGPEPEAYEGDFAGFQVWPAVLPADDLARMADRQLVRLIGASGGMPEALVQLDRVQSAFLRYQDSTREAVQALRVAQARRLELKRKFPSVMVMAEMAKPRPTHVLLRGNYDALGEPVTPGVPESLLGAWPPGAPRNRLGLAQWLTQPGHPLTARVVVNRFWQQIFGIGLVKTAEDFGFQSEYPAHPELLDWLARDFIDGGWNVKDLMRSIVLSATYRQDSSIAPGLLTRDPENRLLGRGPRFRLPAEMIRDHALAVSGLLRERLGGPSVFPDQPEDLYKGVVVDADYPGTKWLTSTGDDLYRRSLYTFWKRTVPHPVMNVFDTPDREFGCVRRSRTNTPLQALTLMNEPALMRAAGHLGQRIQAEGGGTDAARLAWGFRLTTGRLPTPREAEVLAKVQNQLRASYQADSAGAEAMLKSGGVSAAAGQAGESAVWTALASNLLNLDETITKN
ncbi:MAG: DUF1553 domain-containing protein [Verrucomicrobiota bacterium]